MKHINYLTRLEQVLERIGEFSVSLRLREGRCGNPRCNICPEGFHGIYVYAKWREKGRYREVYLGKEIPAGYKHLLNKKEKRKNGRAN